MRFRVNGREARYAGLLVMVETITSSVVIPAGKSREGTISANGTAITCTEPVFGSADIGRLIYSNGELRTIVALISSFTVIIAAEFTVSPRDFEIVTPGTFTGLTVINTGASTGKISVVDGPVADIPKTTLNVGDFKAVAIDGSGTTLTVVYE